MAPALDALIARFHREASATWDPIALEAGTYAQHLANCVACASGASDPLRTLEGLCTADLYLACAVGRAIPGAHLRFSRQFEEAIAGAARAIDAATSFVDEVRQALHQNLTVGGPEGGSGTPKILQYAGRAPLTSWVGVAARRTALALVRAEKTRRQITDRAAEEPLPFELDPELRYLKDRYRTCRETGEGAMKWLKFILPAVLLGHLPLVHAQQETCPLSLPVGSLSWWICLNSNPCPARDPQFSVEAGVTSMSTCTLVVHGPIDASTNTPTFYQEVKVTKRLPSGTLSGCNDDLGYYAEQPGSVRKMECQGSTPTPVTTTLTYGYQFLQCPP
jgi:hypothetical protein